MVGHKSDDERTACVSEHVTHNDLERFGRRSSRRYHHVLKINPILTLVSLNADAQEVTDDIAINFSD